MSKFKQLKVGQAFTFEPSGAVFVRVRGGFKRGCGGPLYNALTLYNVLIKGIPMTLVEVFIYNI